MDTLDVLSDDHATLEAQATHVSALLDAMRLEALSAASVHVEFVQQTEILRDQLLEHFGFEEEGAFPALLELLPQEKETVENLSDAHDAIAGAISQVVNLARRAEGQGTAERLQPIIDAYGRFRQAFARHVLREAEFFERAGGMLNSEQRRWVSERARAAT